MNIIVHAFYRKIDAFNPPLVDFISKCW